MVKIHQQEWGVKILEVYKDFDSIQGINPRKTRLKAPNNAKETDSHKQNQIK